MVELGQQLRTARLACEWKQFQLAKRLRVSKGYLSRLEAGKARPAKQLIQRLAKVCATDPDPLLILAGHLPADLRGILSQHPIDAPARLREAFAEEEHRTVDPVQLAEVVSQPKPTCGHSRGSYEIILQDCFEWMVHRGANTIHAIVTDPPYGLKEYTSKEKKETPPW